MQFNNNISIESIIFIVIILVLIWYIFRLYEKLRNYDLSIDIAIEFNKSKNQIPELLDYVKKLQEVNNAKK